MEIIIHTDLVKTDRDFELAINEYIKRTSPFCKITIKRYKKNKEIAFKKTSKKYVLSPGEAITSSTDFANLIDNNLLHGYSTIEYVVFGNLLSNLSYKDVESFHISSFTMSKDLTITVLCEQIYRAFTILNNITYHK